MNERFEIIRIIGKGRTGGVYEAIDHSVNARVALRRFFSVMGDTDSREWQDAFVGLGENLARVTHPSLMTIYSSGVDEDGAFMSMELLENGRTIEQIIEQEKHFSDENFYMMASSLLGAFGKMHLQGFCHGSLNGRSIMEVPTQSGERIYKCVDLGMFSMIPIVNPELPALACNDPALTAPELFEGSQPDARSDVYMLGHLFYLSLAGGHPLAGIPAEDAHFKHKHHKFAPLSGYRASVPLDIVQWIELLTNADPNSRPQSAGEALSIMPPPSFIGAANMPEPTVTVTPTSASDRGPATTPLVITSKHTGTVLRTQTGAVLRTSSIRQKSMGSTAAVTGPQTSRLLATGPQTSNVVNRQTAAITANSLKKSKKDSSGAIFFVIFSFITIIAGLFVYAVIIRDSVQEEKVVEKKMNPESTSSVPVHTDVDDSHVEKVVPRTSAEGWELQKARIELLNTQVLINLADLNDARLKLEKFQASLSKGWGGYVNGNFKSEGIWDIVFENRSNMVMLPDDELDVNLVDGEANQLEGFGLFYDDVDPVTETRLRYIFKNSVGDVKVRLLAKVENLTLQSAVAIKSKLPEGKATYEIGDHSGMVAIDFEIKDVVESEVFALDFIIFSKTERGLKSSFVPIALLLNNEFQEFGVEKVKPLSAEAQLATKEEVVPEVELPEVRLNQDEFVNGVKITPNANGFNTIELKVTQ